MGGWLRHFHVTSPRRHNHGHIHNHGPTQPISQAEGEDEARPASNATGPPQPSVTTSQQSHSSRNLSPSLQMTETINPLTEDLAQSLASAVEDNRLLRERAVTLQAVIEARLADAERLLGKLREEEARAEAVRQSASASGLGSGSDSDSGEVEREVAVAVRREEAVEGEAETARSADEAASEREQEVVRDLISEAERTIRGLRVCLDVNRVYTAFPAVCA